MSKKKSDTHTGREKPLTIEPIKVDSHLQEICDEMARAATHPRTPPLIHHALQGIVVNLIANESGYNWAEDEEGLRFLLPRYLFHMNELYMRGIVQTVRELIHGGLPADVTKEIRAQVERGGLPGAGSADAEERSEP